MTDPDLATLEAAIAEILAASDGPRPNTIVLPNTPVGRDAAALITALSGLPPAELAAIGREFAAVAAEHASSPECWRCEGTGTRRYWRGGVKPDGEIRCQYCEGTGRGDGKCRPPAPVMSPPAEGVQLDAVRASKLRDACGGDPRRIGGITEHAGRHRLEIKPAPPEACRACEGRGYCFYVYADDGPPDLWDCPDCRGTGYLPAEAS